MPATKEQRQAAAAKIMNAALDNMPMAKSALGEVTHDNWGTWTTNMIEGGYENAFYAYLTDVILQTFVTKANFENPLKRYKKGFVTNGAGVRQRHVDKIDALPYITSDVERRELKTYLASIYEADYLLNAARYYPVTLGRIDFRQAVATEEGVLDLIDTIKSQQYTSNEIDEYAMTIASLQNYILSGRAYTVGVDMTIPLDQKGSFAEVFRTYSPKLARANRKYNEFGVTNSTPVRRQVLWITDELAARYSVEVLSSAFNMSQVDYVTRVEQIDSFDQLPFGYKELQANNNDLPVITPEGLTALGNVVAILFDEDLLQIYDYVNEMWEKERAVMMDINYFLHVWQGYGISPFSDIVVFVDQAIAQPTEITMEVVGKEVKSGRVSFTLNVVRDTPTLTGGYINLYQTDDAASAGVQIYRNGYVRMPSTYTEGIVLSGEFNETTYTAATALTPATNVGDKLTFGEVTS